jgi:hypothetical protein
MTAMNWPPTELASEHLDVLGDAGSWAALSRCGRYRYMLGRGWGESADGLVCVWLMLNPSTADHSKDDPTIRKCRGFAERAGCSSLIVVNLFAWRATDPNDLAKVIAEGREDPVGPLNDQMLALVSERRPLIVGWGKVRKAFRARADSVWSRGLSQSWPMQCLGVNDDGSPRHPLFVPYEVKPLLLGQARENLRAGLPHGLPAC